jgi:hypothetical protein
MRGGEQTQNDERKTRALVLGGWFFGWFGWCVGCGLVGWRVVGRVGRDGMGGRACDAGKRPGWEDGEVGAWEMEGGRGRAWDLGGWEVGASKMGASKMEAHAHREHRCIEHKA